MYCDKCGTKLNEQGICPKCNGLQVTGNKSVKKIILLVSLIGCVASALCGMFVWSLTANEIENTINLPGMGIENYTYTTMEHNVGATICIILIGMLVTVAIDIYIYVKNKNK